MKKSKVLQLVIALIALVVIIFIVYAVFFKEKMEVQISKDNEVQFDTITANVQGDEYHYLKMNMTLVGADKMNAQAILDYKRNIRQYILNFTAKQNGLDVLKKQEDFKQKIKDGLRDELDINVKKIYFTDYVLAP